MKNLIPIVLLFVVFANYSCNNNDKLGYNSKDTIAWQPSIKILTYDPRIQHLNYIPESTELPNEYQHKSQLFIDSTVCMSWSAAGFKNGNSAIKFYQNLQLNIKFNEKNAVANLINFPLRDGTSKKEFLDNYDKIFTIEFKRELLEQSPFELFRNKNGCMAGNDGQLWFKPTGHGFRIFELNHF